jgi:AGCS family alanine or glycine:cation symporter
VGFHSLLYYFSDHFLVYPLSFIFLLSIILTIKLRFIQIRALPTMFKMLVFNRTSVTEGSSETISPRTALLVSMSTAIGLSNIAGPIVALGFGGPAALAGFVFASIFGAATTFLEIFLALKYRRVDTDGIVLGGPMQYLKKEFSMGFAQFYALSLFFLLMFWTSSQANNLSTLLEAAGMPRLVTGVILAFLMLIVLVGGIKRVGALNDALVPVMCALYCLCTMAVIYKNLTRLPIALRMIFGFGTSKEHLFGAFTGISLVTSMRWGMSRAIQANEVGIGTSTFPHSATSAVNPYYQAVLGMAPVYATAFLTTLTGVTVLVTDVWKEAGAVFNISMFFNIMKIHFPKIGPTILLLCGFLFAFGTILGNCYNASRCYSFLLKGRGLLFFYAICAVFVCMGSIAHVKFIWTVVDFFVIPVAIPHMVAIFIIAFRTNIFHKGT